ncbi:MAG TPA: bifunctional nuclease family protein [Abditibacteriaceae bacterium]
MLRMTIEGVGFDHLRQTVVVLKDWESQKLLPIWIGAAEAKSIALHLEGTTPPRPLSHDLLLNCLGLAGGNIVRVVINDLQDNTFYATVDVDTPNGVLHIDSRPSDAIALAVRAKCPVFVDGGALDALVDIGIEEKSSAPAETTDAEPEESTASSNSLDASSLQNSASGDEDIDRFRRLVGDIDL